MTDDHRIPKRLGMLTPSSNTVLEPTTARMLAGMPDVTAHFGRVRVTGIALTQDSLTQFAPAAMVEAALLLADAKMDVIAWNGTSAGWLGFDSDERLCSAVTTATGARATSSVLALNVALHRLGASRVALVTPYTADVQARIIANYQAHGIEIVAERHLDDPGNFSFAQYDDATVADLVRDVAQAGPQAIAVLCTNFRGAGRVQALEAELGIPVLDSIAVTLWHCMNLAEVSASRVQGWGTLFAL